MYNKLMRFRSVALIEHNKKEHLKNMKTNDIKYLHSLSDESQYPTARCTMGDNVCMHYPSSSGAVKLMNKANKEMRA